MRGSAAGVDDPLGDPFVIEVRDLLAEVEVLQQCRAAITGAQGVVGIVDTKALCRREPLARLGEREAPRGVDRIGLGRFLHRAREP